jgi:AcrR family transcriptional regulator
MVERRGQGVRIEDIAKAAGVSRQAVYMHFGSRSGLLIATARYLDEKLGLNERTRPIREATNAVQALEATVEWWANYIPDIYGLAKALLTARDTDEAAAAAWEDRMDALYRGCQNRMQWLADDGLLSPKWSVEEAADFLWATISIANWELLTIECGWTNEQFIARAQHVLNKTLLKDP